MILPNPNTHLMSNGAEASSFSLLINTLEGKKKSVVKNLGES